ncbi:glycosyltransferase family 2 protein [Paenibacillus typhae]|uniref:4,4'-diaponeurosporenoate glycosyltransferase n=1 Tax=Paenibacillus typhae TaxID=1174501 RepID=A0A1G8YZN5_9BACL|nr:glycosyltransferase [Paenibacillus typhae]SDK08241.1 Glycosyl transferase family 2 [Paenibacillus typhae]
MNTAKSNKQGISTRPSSADLQVSAVRSASRAAGGRRSANAAPRTAAGRPASGAARKPRRTTAAKRLAAGAKQTQKLPRKLGGKLSVIISARNEAKTLPLLLKQVQRLAPAEIIVVLNGCTDNSFQLARLCRQATVVHVPEPAGHDVGRSLGAKLSRGDILLFLDGDMVITAPQLAGFAAAVDGGVDVALNDLDGLLPPFGLSDHVTRSKLYLNMVLGRSDLGASSMTAVPHALSRRALEAIGYRELMVPPKAQALSLLKQLRVEKAGTVNVFKQNRLRQDNTGAGNRVEQLIIGDHAEALKAVLMLSRANTGAGSLQEQRSQLAAWRNAL